MGYGKNVNVPLTKKYPGLYTYCTITNYIHKKAKVTKQPTIYNEIILHFMCFYAYNFFSICNFIAVVQYKCIIMGVDNHWKCWQSVSYSFEPILHTFLLKSCIKKMRNLNCVQLHVHCTLNLLPSSDTKNGNQVWRYVFNSPNNSVSFYNTVIKSIKSYHVKRS